MSPLVVGHRQRVAIGLVASGPRQPVEIRPLHGRLRRRARHLRTGDVRTDRERIATDVVGRGVLVAAAAAGERSVLEVRGHADGLERKPERGVCRQQPGLSFERSPARVGGRRGLDAIVVVATPGDNEQDAHHAHEDAAY